MEKQIGVKYSDRRAIQVMLVEVQGIGAAADCSDGKLAGDALSSSKTVISYLGTRQSSVRMFKGLLGGGSRHLGQVQP